MIFPAVGRTSVGVALAVTLVVLFSSGGCERKIERPDIVLVTIDTLRADHCSAYGYELPTTPTLEALASKGILYRRAYAESSTTAPSHAVLMTGRHFRTLGVDKNGAVLPKEEITLAEALSDQGYATAAFISSFPLLKRFGFAQGFDHYDDGFVMDEASLGRRKEGGKSHDRFAEATVAHVKKWLEKRHDSRPLFLWVHFVDPHAPYKSPEKFDATWPKGISRVIPRYDAEVRYADRNLGVVLDLVSKHTPEREDLVVVTSDHGEGLGDHDWLSHGINLYEEAVRVPMIATWPGRLPAGRVEEIPVSIVDIAPGILGLLGIEKGSFAHGRNLFAEADPSRSIFLQRRQYKSGSEHGRKISGEMVAVVEKGKKLILAPEEERRELYRLGSDPEERSNLLGPPPTSKRRRPAPATAASEAAEQDVTPKEKADRENEARAREQLLADWETAFPLSDRSGEPVDKETLKALRSLGYVD